MDGDKEEIGGLPGAAITVEKPWALERVVRVIEGIASELASHTSRCDKRVQGIALHPSDHAQARLHSVGTLPILALDDIKRGNARLICECDSHLIPDLDGVDDFENFCDYGML